MGASTHFQTHAPVGDRLPKNTCGSWLMDGVTTIVKGIANNFFPIRATDSYGTQVAKIAVKIAAIPLTVAAICLYPLAMATLALSAIAIGLLVKSTSHII